MSTFRGVGIRALPDTIGRRSGEHYEKKEAIPRFVCKGLKNRADLWKSLAGPPGIRTPAQSAAGRNLECSYPAAPDASGYFLSFASTVIFVAVRASPSPVNSTFTFDPAAVARPAA